MFVIFIVFFSASWDTDQTDNVRLLTASNEAILQAKWYEHNTELEKSSQSFRKEIEENSFMINLEASVWTTM